MKLAESITTSPRADIYSYKSLGYSFKTALADIIDNSISAGAKNIHINSDLNSEQPYIQILDDGKGMDIDELIIAMKPGGKDPTKERDNNDLGRFGLGLKSASFSQCNILKVISKKDKGELYTRTWNLNYVIENDQWQLFEEEISPSEERLIGPYGTLVVWRDFSNQNDDTKSNALKTMLNESYNYCRLVFHRFIEEGGVSIFFNSQLVSAYDPFLKYNKKVMRRPIENKSFGTIQTHILPIPQSNAHKTELDNYELIEGFNNSQGVYIYRENRLIAYGGWFGIIKNNELNKLARVSIDYNNNLDSIWSLDVVKSQAIPPKGSRNFLKRIFYDASENSKAAFKEKGKRIHKANPFSKEKPDEIWIDHLDKDNDKHSYKINPKNAYIEYYCKQFNLDVVQLKPLFKIIGDLLPLEQIIENHSENPNTHLRDNYPDNPSLFFLAKNILESYIEAGNSKDEALRKLQLISPFNKYPELISAL